MIYIVEKYCDIAEHYTVNSIWEVDCEDVGAKYREYILDFAQKEAKIVINTHWLNIMNHKDHHPHLSVKEYKQKEKSWKNFLNSKPIEWYIKEHLKGTKLEFKTLNG